MEEIEYIKGILKGYLKEELKDNSVNHIFFANKCHICHCLDGVEKRLKRCGSCNLISYCGTEHQAKHWPVHRKLCKVAKSMITANGGNSVFGNTKGLDKKDWVKLKKGKPLMVFLKLIRELTHSEQQMFFFPRFCCICHESDPQKLTNCLDCGNSSFCEEHISDPRHKLICSQFALCYKFGLLKQFTDHMLVWEIVAILLNTHPLNCVPYAAKQIEFDSMRQFIQAFFRQIIDNRCENKKGSIFWDIFISEYFTRPLTLFSAMKLLNYKPEAELIVHIIGSDYLEINEISAWEILFHLIPGIKKLTIFLIGPELKADAVPESMTCVNCREGRKILDIVVVKKFYHEFVNETITKPNFIVGYNLGISECENPGEVDDTWHLTIFKIAELNVPIVITSFTEGEINNDHARICHFLKMPITSYTCLQQNQFASLRPFRDFETDGVFHQNDYLVVYKDWQSKN